MKFKSIQFSVAALAGAIVLSIVAALVLYAVYSGNAPRRWYSSAPSNSSKA